MILRLISVIPCCFVLVLCIVSITSILRDSPSLNHEMRVDGLFGDWRVPVQAALYDRSEYLFQIGFTFLQGDVVVSSATETRDQIATAELALQRAGRARQSLEESLRLAPGNAYAWGFLGWARALEAEVPGSLDALSASWELSPHNGQLALSRLNLLEVLVEIDSSLLIEHETTESAARDLWVLYAFDYPYFRQAIKDSPLLTELARANDLIN